MRIQTSDTLATPDAEMVLRALERSLHDVSVEVVREGQRITIRGLGPSQRTMNRNDVGVVEVENENNHTVVRSDITFLASALMGGVPQDDLVRSKLDRVLDRVKLELGTKSVREETLPWVSDSIDEGDGEARHVFAEPEVVAAHSVDPEPADVSERIVEIEWRDVFEGTTAVSEPGHASVEEAAVEAEPVHEAEPVRVAEPVHEAEPVREAERVQEHEPAPVAEAEPVVLPVSDVAPQVESPIVPVTGLASQESKSTVAVKKAGPVEVSSQSGARLAVPMFQSFQAEEPQKPKRWGLFATVVCMLAAVSLFLAWPYLVGLVHDRLTPASSVTEESAVDEATKPADNKTPMQMPDANAAAVRDAAIHNESDPRIWLESWAEAMRGQDAGAQASFYADPVEHYALKTNVSNADVWLDKKNSIQNRPASWTVKMEDVVIEPRPDESIRVRLTKHFTSGSDGGRVSDQSIHSQLKLKKIDGQWKIVSEQNLASES